MTVRGGVIVVNKPVGSTSFGCVARVRRAVGVRRVGHCGTLDPFAEGVLPVCVGRATGLVRYMEGYDKEYRVTVRFGAETDTQDVTGKRTGGREPSEGELDGLRADGFQSIRALAAALEGDRMQTPPMYSAVKVDGRPLYESARKGVEIGRKARPIRVHAVHTDSVSADDGVLRAVLTIRCSKGTYIRTLCEDLGRATGFGAHAETLLRTRCGPYGIEQAHALEELDAACLGQGEGALGALAARGWLAPLESAVLDRSTAVADRETARRIVDGLEVSPEALGLPTSDLPETVAVLKAGLGLLAVCRLDASAPGSAVYRAERVFTDSAQEKQDG
jgi:tRNA pseudouridine55 synthase